MLLISMIKIKYEEKIILCESCIKLGNVAVEYNDIIITIIEKKSLTNAPVKIVLKMIDKILFILRHDRNYLIFKMNCICCDFVTLDHLPTM